MYLPSVPSSKMMRGVYLLGVFSFVSTIVYAGLRYPDDFDEKEPIEMLDKSLSYLGHFANPTREKLAMLNTSRALTEYQVCEVDCLDKKGRYLLSQKRLENATRQRAHARRAQRVRARKAQMATQQEEANTRRANRVHLRQKWRQEKAASESEALRDGNVAAMSAGDRAAYFQRERYAFNKARRDEQARDLAEMQRLRLRDRFIAQQKERLAHLDPLERIVARKQERDAINERLAFESSIANFSPVKKNRVRRDWRKDFRTTSLENRMEMVWCEQAVKQLIREQEDCQEEFAEAHAAQEAAFVAYVHNFNAGYDDCAYLECWDFTHDDIKFDKQEAMEAADFQLAEQRYECESMALDHGQMVVWTGSLHWFVEEDGRLAEEMNFSPAPTPSPISSNPDTPHATCGNADRGNGICHGGQCCSDTGWCGTTDLHCNTDPLWPWDVQEEEDVTETTSTVTTTTEGATTTPQIVAGV